ncbi:carbonic anhydrase [Taibaiella lutea]|uniref:Carbonic anhydrase n=1 Tax=Taibaiella lutea TaxID=2608001 RepID=A0A5M6CPR9_9BACT|nr:carbonic anhydrase family protein [Taibaiella lutea]KAA5536996.1 carbonic anhydrase [Taibaiella lutea]
MAPVNIDPSAMTADLALQLLKDGNERFTSGLSANRDLLQKVKETKDGQKPFAAILSCMDSRAPAELIFDQGIGDIFNIRVAGNVISPYVLGSLEYAVAVAGSKLILVMGHTGCGAIKGACDDVKLGNLTDLLAQIKDSVTNEITETENRTGTNSIFVNKVSMLNVLHSVEQMMAQSEVIRSYVENGTIKIIPAMYDVSTGIVSFQHELQTA